SPTYRWDTPFTRLRKENPFEEFVKLDNDFYIYEYVNYRLSFVFEKAVHHYAIQLSLSVLFQVLIMYLL
ncbi:hypothetical protein, partial [Bacillus cereus]|uniref:hypothetical protein n=1 Tax=Bacillus cereus TaxID=1396 RepID=UPI001C3F0B8C